MSIILRYSDLEKRGLGSRWTIKRKVADGKLPPPRDDGQPFWLEDEIEAALRELPQWQPDPERVKRFEGAA